MFRSVAADQSPVNFRPGKLAADIAQVDVKGFCLLNREKGSSLMRGLGDLRAAVVDPCTLWFSISCVSGAKCGETGD